MQALQFLTGLVQDGSVSKSVVLWTQADVESQFAAGKAAMMENGPWNIGQLQAVPGLHWASVPLPCSPKPQARRSLRAAGRRDLHGARYGRRHRKDGRGRKDGQVHQ